MIWHPLALSHTVAFFVSVPPAVFIHRRNGHTPERLHTSAKVRLDKVGEGFEITKITLELEGEVPDLSKEEFEKFAHTAKANCPVSKALAGTEIELEIK